LRILLGDDGRQRVAREAIYRGGYFFANVLRGAIDVAFEDEGAGDVSKTFAGVDSDFVNAAYRLNSVLERQDNASDDFFGSRAR